MSRSRPLLVATVIFGALALGACASKEAKPTPAATAGAGATVASGGDVSTRGGMTPGLGDSVSVRADLGRIRGAEKAGVWLVEVSDFQCPYCKRWHDDTYATLDREYVQTGKVHIAYINYPLSSIHANARAAAETAMCASAQGKFWPVHDGLFGTQEQWARLKDPMPVFDSLATAAAVDQAGWRSCMSTHATAALIDADIDRWSRAGVKSTPSFFVANRGLVGAYPADSFRVIIDSALAAQARGTR